MKTITLRIDPKKPQARLIQKAAIIIQRGELVAFPTETVYGLGANALSSKALRKIFKAKGRPSDNPLIVHIAEKKQLLQLVDHIPPAASKLIKKFWPGPLTIIFKKSAIVPVEISSGLDTVAVRLPKNKIARALIRAAGFPLAAPSANLSGRPSPTGASHVAEDLKWRIACIIDGGSTHIGLESTVIDMTRRIPTILRPGKISPEEIKRVVGNVHLHPVVNSDKKIITARSPGMKYRHYAPKAELRIFQGDTIKIKSKIQNIIRSSAPRKIAVLVTNRKHYFPDAETVYIGSSSESIARNLFSVLRRMDDRKIDLILIESVSEKGLGLAIMNRLKKAAGFNIVRVP
jgi:L-threonylcarbamoyladenylate synthase